MLLINMSRIQLFVSNFISNCRFDVFLAIYKNIDLRNNEVGKNSGSYLCGVFFLNNILVNFCIRTKRLSVLSLLSMPCSKIQPKTARAIMSTYSKNSKIRTPNFRNTRLFKIHFLHNWFKE